MKRALQVYKSEANENSLARWWKYKHPIIVAWNLCLITLAKYCPSLRLKNVILRLTGMKIGKGARIALGAMFDIFYPEKITIGENSIIGYNATILTHEYLIGEMRAGETAIGSGVLIGANSTVLAGVKIGDGATVSAMTLVNDDVPAGAYAEGVPMKIVKKGKR